MREPDSSTATELPTEAALGRGGFVRLLLVLSGVAFGAFAMRGAAMAQATLEVGAPFQWSTLASIETANWLAWSVWALALIPQAWKLLEHPSGRAFGFARVFFAVVAPSILVPMLVAFVHRPVFNPSGTLVDSYVHVVRHNLAVNLLLGAAMLGAATGLIGLQRTRRAELRAERLNAALTQAQLDTLRSQLNPHFLFNALNSIVVLARRGSLPEVERMVDHLAALLRHSLDSARDQRVPLRVELAALRHYVDIEEVRHGDRLAVTIDAPVSLHSSMVPSFLLQPLVENAIRHGFDHPTRRLSVAVSVKEEPGRLVLQVADDGAGIPPDENMRDGIGLSHTKARIAGLYGGAASLRFGPGLDARGASVVITLPKPTHAEGLE